MNNEAMRPHSLEPRPQHLRGQGQFQWDRGRTFWPRGWGHCEDLSLETCSDWASEA